MRRYLTALTLMALVGILALCAGCGKTPTGPGYTSVHGCVEKVVAWQRYAMTDSVGTMRVDSIPWMTILVCS